MQRRQWQAVCGYIRRNFKSTLYLDDINAIIHQYILINIDTHILSIDEQNALIDLLYDTLNKQNPKTKMIPISTTLIFRASEHNFDSVEFHEICDHRGATITIIHNSNNHVFGGYATESWNISKSISDPTAFLYVIRPTMQIFELRKNKNRGHAALATGYYYDSVLTTPHMNPNTDYRYGPGYGAWYEPDIYVSQDAGFVQEQGKSFDIDALALTGAHHPSLVTIL